MDDEAIPAASGNDRVSAAARRKAVRERYAGLASDSTACCDDDAASGGGDPGQEGDSCGDLSSLLGYSEDDRDAVVPGANLGLGCGNPTAIASLADGDTVLDLGSGAGFDCFLAAREVGATGRVIGVDMTPEMVERARANIEENEATNVEFRLGEIEHLPVADTSVDVVISNCVVNLSPDKRQVFREAYRVIRPGGRLAISDVVLTAELPGEIRRSPESLVACVGGAEPITSLDAMLGDAGFVDIDIEPKADSDRFIREWDDEHDLSDYLVSATIEAQKPAV